MLSLYQIRCHIVGGALAAAIALLATASPAAVRAQDSAPDDAAMLEYLTERLKENPAHSDSWRLLGRLHRKRGDHVQARECLQQALELSDENAAAHFDLGQLLTEEGDKTGARIHFRRVLELAPESTYATEIRDAGFDPGWLSQPPTPAALPAITAAEFANLLPTDVESGMVLPVDYEAASLSFDSSGELQRQIDRLADDDRSRRFRGTIDLGAVYNTNVTLTPISRSLRNVDAASAQLLFNPSVDWTIRENHASRAGALFRGSFTVNEHHLDHFNLSSFQPGAFFEKAIGPGELDTTFRLEYGYALDRLGDNSLGNRHSLTGSLLTVHPRQIDWIYATLAYSQFNDDGLNPAVDSLDGATWSAGAARFFLTGHTLVPTWTLGGDLELADTTGADARYRSVRLYSDATICLSGRVSLVPSAAIGFRNYPDFTGFPERDELTGRLGGKLKYQFHERASIALFVNYDRFHSDNALYGLDRVISGIVATYTW